VIEYLVAGAALYAYSKRDAIASEGLAILPAFEKYDALFKRNGKIHGVPWRWLKAIAMNESSLGLNPRVLAGLVSSDGLSYGLMQVTLTTARELRPGTTADDLNDPEISIGLSAKYVRRMMDRFGGDREKTIRAYNGGPGFQTTLKGQTDTPIYYARFVRNLTTVLEKQPGNERELG
jgi:soluble lytic murein transglycosylase-like protein